MPASPAMEEEGEQGDERAHLRAGEGSRKRTSTKPMLCRYRTHYCCRKAKDSAPSTRLLPGLWKRRCSWRGILGFPS